MFATGSLFSRANSARAFTCCERFYCGASLEAPLAQGGAIRALQCMAHLMRRTLINTHSLLRTTPRTSINGPHRNQQILSQDASQFRPPQSHAINGPQRAPNNENVAIRHERKRLFWRLLTRDLLRFHLLPILYKKEFYFTLHRGMGEFVVAVINKMTFQLGFQRARSSF